jgi:hypothetical protein
MPSFDQREGRTPAVREMGGVGVLDDIRDEHCIVQAGGRLRIMLDGPGKLATRSFSFMDW